MSNWNKVSGVSSARCVIVMQRKTPQSYAFCCFGEFSGPMVFQSEHDQIGSWYIRYASSTSVLRERTYFIVFLAGFALEF